MSLDVKANRPTSDDNPSWIDVRGVHTALRRGGEGEPLLYLHGSGLTKRWLPIHTSLARSFDVVAPEHPGYGDTKRPRWYRELDDMVLHYADLLDTLGLERVHVVGHSFGGRLAGAFAAVFPRRLLSLTLLAPAPLDPGGPEGPPPWDIDVDPDELLFNGNQEHYPEFLNGDDEGLIVDVDDGDSHSNPGAWSIDTAPALYRRLARVECPSTVIVPDDDMLIPNHFFDEWAHYIPGAEIARVTGRQHPTGHLFIVQEPDEIARLVMDRSR